MKILNAARARSAQRGHPLCLNLVQRRAVADAPAARVWQITPCSGEQILSISSTTGRVATGRDAN
eukprot:3151124-Pyramimonas_sp.AAC.1